MSKGIVLIGMPAAGKSTIGKLLAKLLGCQFVDSDHCIEHQQGASLQAIVDSDGYSVFKRIEEHVLLGIDPESMVLATGGSVIYSDPAMQHLAAKAHIVYLNVQADTLLSRLENAEQRGLARKPGQSFASLLAERLPLYERYAEININTEGLTAQQTAEKIAEHVR
ncbi:MAG: shikimate kinase [Pseudomonadales bacterium]